MAIFSAVAAAVGSFFASLTWGAVGSFLLRSVASMGLSALAQKLSGKKSSTQPMGVKGQMDRGADVPQAFIVGRYATAGSLTYANTSQFGATAPNGWLTWVITLSDLPCTAVTEFWVNGVKQELEDSIDGWTSAVDFIKGGGERLDKDRLQFKFYDGTQTTPDPWLTEHVSSAERLWQPSAVGYGKAYVVVRAHVDSTLFRNGFPNFLFGVEGIPLYDISKDSSMGGSGAHRWADPATWEPSENAAVQLYNVLRGIRYNGQWFYGLQGVTAAQLPAAHWIAQVNKCAATIEGANGPEPLYRSSGEIPVSAEIHTVIEGLLTACNGRLSDAGGVYKLYAGAPDAPVAVLKDDDILSTSDQSFTPFLGLAETVNGVSAKYPSPAAGWQVETAPPLYNPDYEAEDGGRRLLVDVALDFVPYAEQAQRLMQAALNEARRARRHTFHLPPKFWPLEPGDVIAWTSERNGYQSKQFRVDGVIDLPDADVIVDLTEVDPADYAFDSATDFTPPAEPGVLPQAIPVQEVEGFAVSPASLNDETGTGRRPAILAVWNGDLADVRAVVFELRVAATGEAVDPARSDTVSDGHVYISNGILPAVTYEVRAQFIPESPRPTEWTLWQGVTAPDLRLGADDLATVINDQLAAVDVLADDLATVEATANGVRQDHDALIEGFTKTNLGQLEVDYDATQAAAANAQTARDQAQTARDTSLTYRDASNAAKNAAETAKGLAETAKTDAQAAAVSASDSEGVAVSSATDAAGSAQAAATSEANAGFSETAAGQSASAAQTAKTAAETARSGAESAETAAATSETNAAGSASSAATSATNAATSENNAGDSATAASGSASTATTKANEAGTSATAANSAKVAAETARDSASGHASAASSSASAASASETAAGQSAAAANTAKTAAQTAKGQAEAARDAAATSETNAAGSASAAFSSESVAARAATAAATKNLVTNPTGLDDADGWVSASSSDVVPAHAPTGAKSLHIGDGARVVPLIKGEGLGRIFRVSMWARTIDCTVYLTVLPRGERADAPGIYTSGMATTKLEGTDRINPGLDWHLHEFVAQISQSTLQYTPAFDLGPAGDRAQVYDVKWEDITESYNAEQSATAAATSASSAAASETAAGQSASSATTAKNAAETARGGAESARDAAATSETNAAGSASAASTSATNAANSASNALGSANAASTSASTASTKADEASASATSATTSKNQAQTAKGQAEAAQSAAATSESNAAGSANAASISADLAASYADDASTAEADVRATLNSDYYTSAQADSAISSATTSLKSEMEGAGGSVKAAQDAAQAASTLAGSKGKVFFQQNGPTGADRNAQNLWIDTTGGANTPKRWSGTAWVAVTDKVATDAAAAAAAAQGTANTVSSNLANNYYTKTSTDNAIAQARQDLEAEISSVEQNAAAFHEVLSEHDPAKVGAAVGASTGAAALGQPGTVLITENATARDSGGATNGYYLSVPTDKALQFAARRIKVSVLARRPSTNAATSFGVSYSSAEVGNSGVISFTSSTNWDWYTFYYDVLAPIAGGFDYIGIFGDDSKTGKATEVARVQVEIAAEAAALPEISELQGDITNIYALDANGLDGTVFGAMINELNVAGNGKIAGVDNFGTAMADLHGNVSASYLLRARAGGEVGELEVVAWDDASGGGSAIFLSAEYIFAKGTLSANLLTVGNNDNLLSNTDYADGLTSFLQNTNGASGAETAMSIRPSTASWTDGVRPVLELGQLGSSAAGFSDVIFRRVLGHGGLGFIEVEPSESYEFSAYVSTHRCTAQMYVQWRNAANTVVSTDVLPIPEDGGSSTDPLSWQRPFLIKKAPASAKFANLFIRKYGTLSGTSSYLFVHHPMFALTHADATQPSKYVPKGITYVDGQQIITGSVTADKMSVNELSAISANIGHFKSAASGERIEIMDDVIKVFDAGGQVRVKIGNLLA